MNNKTFLILLVFSLLFSCGNNNSDTPSNTENNTDTQVSKITEKAIEALKYDDYVLSSDAEQIVVDWLNYQELTTQIGFLKKLDFSFFRNETSVTKEFLTELKTTIPETIDTNPINARLTVVETTLLRLKNNLSIDNLPIEEKLESIKAFLEAVSHLNYLINKKLEFDKTDIERPE